MGGVGHSVLVVRIRCARWGRPLRQRLGALVFACCYVAGCRSPHGNANDRQGPDQSPILLADPDVQAPLNQRENVGTTCTSFPVTVSERRGCADAHTREVLRKLTARLVACARVYAPTQELNGELSLSARVSAKGEVLESRAWSTGAIRPTLVACFRDFSGIPLSGMAVVGDDCLLTLTFQVNRQTCPRVPSR
jgi:hypothetical protein